MALELLLTILVMPLMVLDLPPQAAGPDLSLLLAEYMTATVRAILHPIPQDRGSVDLFASGWFQLPVTPIDPIF